MSETDDNNVLRLIPHDHGSDEGLLELLIRFQDSVKSHGGITGIAAVVSYTNGDTGTAWDGNCVALLAGHAILGKRLLGAVEDF